MGLTFYLAVVSCILSFFGGLILGLLAISRNRVIRYASEAVIQCVRGMPLIMVIFWMYFLYPNLMGQPMPESQTVILALTFFTSAYMSQIVKAGIEKNPKGQTEAAISTGLTHRHTMLYIILPQALRNMIPSFVNHFVSLIKDTSLAFIVGVSELPRWRRRSTTARSSIPPRSSSSSPSSTSSSATRLPPSPGISRNASPGQRRSDGSFYNL